MDAVDASSTRKLENVRVRGVLGEYDHEFGFRGDQGLAIIYGPNGVGKTRLLEIIEALVALNFAKLNSLPFSAGELQFSDGYTFSVAKVPKLAEDDATGSESDSILFDLKFVLKHRRRVLASSQISAGSDFVSWLSRMTPWQPVDGSEIWRNELDGDVALFSDLRPRYFARYRHETRRQGEAAPRREIDPTIQAFVDDLRIKLIETQRLTAFDVREGSRNRYGASEGARSVPTINRNSDEIKRLLNVNLSENSRLTQSLDSTFPRRMLERGSQSSLSEDDLRAKWAEQTKRRARLTEIADLKVDPQLSLPDDKLNEWQLGMLELYLEDADQKLASFSEVLAKINLLEQIINERLLAKNLHIDANNGMVVSRERDKSIIPLTALSSGEQHEIILLFDLLFNVHANSVVLIDEPEISLHIGWQKKFIADVLLIAGLVGFQFCVATHSPQIIGRWWALADRLGPKSSDFLGEDEGGVAEDAGEGAADAR
ncbi:AAA family ATPase [Curtobacterium poinsettiae]|uniref:AAA family ATPase n=1 Tax=Curtobacterium poinsettiae TaxID=159612 RepID=UPI00235E99AC|nr:AAA family ATPase [Curtobacterium flaccumfaciens]MDD1385687.1 AAA family ATPase [Curtobacterium flaccumfaciens pv. poinsettiae]